MIRQLFHIKNAFKNVKNLTCLNGYITILDGQYYRGAMPSTFSQTVSGIIKPSLKVLGLF